MSLYSKDRQGINSELSITTTTTTTITITTSSDTNATITPTSNENTMMMDPKSISDNNFPYKDHSVYTSPNDYQLQAYLSYTAGSILGHLNKVNVTIKWSHELFGFPCI